jgi:hypothetical protein
MPGGDSASSRILGSGPYFRCRGKIPDPSSLDETHAGAAPARGPADRYLLMLRTLSVEAPVQFAEGQSPTLAVTTAMPGRNGAPATLAAARADTCCGLPVQVNLVWVAPWATRSPAACVIVELTLPSSPAPQVAVNTTRIAAPLATSAAEVTLIAGMLVALAAARAAGAGAAGEAVAAYAGTDTSAAVQATATSPVSRPEVRAGKCRTFPFARVRHTPRAGCATRPARSRCLISTDVIIVSPVTVVGGPLPPGRQSAAPAPIQKGSLPPHGDPLPLPYLILYDSVRHAPVAGFV